jgi:thymidine kinase
MDWHEHPFRVTGLLCAMATTVTKLQARCAVCGSPAAITQKKGGGAKSLAELRAEDLY